MEHLSGARRNGLAEIGFHTHPGWLLVLLGVVVWQAWMTLGLFGPDQPWQRLLDDQPIVSGQHPLHLYHGYLGARSLLREGTSCCYDPAFQAGYPKTPVFDSGSRPAELFLALAGGGYHPAAYKLGLAVCCILVPLFLAVAARGVGMGPAMTCLAAALGALVWWGGPCRDLLEAGDLDLLLAVLAGVVHVGLLLRFDRTPRFTTWLGLLAIDSLGWFAQPLFFVTLVPLNFIYYLSIGTRHRHLGWHLALIAALAGGLTFNLFWLSDWVTYWWILSPLPVGLPILEQRTLYTIWTAALWGSPVDRTLTGLLLGGAMVGVCILNQCKHRAAARLLGLAAGCFVALAIAGIALEPLGRRGTPKLLVPALWFAVLPASYAVVQVLCLLRQWLNRTASYSVPADDTEEGACVLHWRFGLGSVAAQMWIAALLLSGLGAAQVLAPPAALEIGLGPQRQAVVTTLSAQTTPEARILWEDQSTGETASCWTALLPLLTQRAYLGGLGPRADFDYSWAGMAAPNLADRPLSDWTDLELAEFCTHYNIGWVVCRTPAAVERFRGWQSQGVAMVEATTELPAEPGAGQTAVPGYLFALRRPRSFVLKGKARVLRADWERIVLGDVVPEEGQVVLSLHYQTGLQVSPSRVRIDREPELHDPIPLIRLWVSGPVTRLTLTWGH